MWAGLAVRPDNAFKVREGSFFAVKFGAGIGHWQVRTDVAT